MKRVIGFVIPLSIVSIGLIILAYSGLSFNHNSNNFFKQPDCRDNLKIAAGLKGGDSNLFADATKKLVEKYYNKEICITVVETSGTRENIERLQNEEAQLATAQADILVMKDLPALKPVNGKRVELNSSVKLDSAQAVSLLYLDMYQLVVRDDSNIRSVSDLKDKRVAMPPKTGGQIDSFAFLMKHYGLIEKNLPLFKLVEVGDEKEAFCNKEVDAVFYVRGVGNPIIGELLTRCHGRLVDIDQAEAMVSKNPYLEATEIPQAVYQGGSNPIPAAQVNTVSVPRLLVAHKNLSKEVIQEIIRILDEHKNELVTEIPLADKMTSPSNLKGGLGMPIHPGRQAYDDRGNPSWIEKNAGAIQTVLGIAGILIAMSPGVWFWLQQREQRRKNKAEDYIREVTALMDAQDCIQALVEYLKNDNSEQKAKFQDIIVKKAAKILVKKQEAVLDHRKKLISNDSLNSFRRSLERVVGAIKNIPESEEIFGHILHKAMKSLLKQWKKPLLNQLLSLISSNKPEIAIEEKLKADLEQNLREAKPLTGTAPTLQSSQSVQFLESARREMQRDLDAIFRRATNALVEERISEASFQSFRVVWQVAAGDDRENHRSS